jgi:hypothetical protein
MKGILRLYSANTSAFSASACRINMEWQPENVETQLSVEQNKLIDLERQKSIIETEDRRGFGDAVRLIQLRGDMEALEGRIRREKQRAKDKHGG